MLTAIIGRLDVAPALVGGSGASAVTSFSTSHSLTGATRIVSEWLAFLRSSTASWNMVQGNINDGGKEFRPMCFINPSRCPNAWFRLPCSSKPPFSTHQLRGCSMRLSLNIITSGITRARQCLKISLTSLVATPCFS